MKHNVTDNLQFPKESSVIRRTLIVGVVFLLMTLVGYVFDSKQFYFSYLTSFAFYSGLGIISLFFVMLQHITRSSWSVVMRRIPEVISSNIFIWSLFVIPLFLGAHDLYHWTHAELFDPSHPDFDPLIASKEGYLNLPFFIARQVIYFAIWGFLGWRVYKNSVSIETTGDWGYDTAQRKVSAPGILLFSLTCAFASFDWLMSLDPHWFSTMFGVYYFAMNFQAFFPAMILMTMYLHKKGMLTNTIGLSHLNDMGKLTFGFTVFYAYIAFSQFFLIYYANIPEETLWYYHRMEGSWIYVMYSLLIARFIIPFIVLLPMNSKRNLKVLRFMSIWILVMHFIELYWVVMPTLHKDGVVINWMDVTAFVGLGGIFLYLFFNRFSKHAMIPVNDPKLAESLNKH